MKVPNVEQLLAELSAGEKAQVLQWLVRDLGHASPGIDSRSHVSGGDACIVRTRIPVWLLEQGASKVCVNTICSLHIRHYARRIW